MTDGSIKKQDHLLGSNLQKGWAGYSACIDGSPIYSYPDAKKWTGEKIVKGSWGLGKTCLFLEESIANFTERVEASDTGIEHIVASMRPCIENARSHHRLANYMRVPGHQKLNSLEHALETSVDLSTDVVWLEYRSINAPRFARVAPSTSDVLDFTPSQALAIFVARGQRVSVEQFYKHTKEESPNTGKFSMLETLAHIFEDNALPSGKITQDEIVNAAAELRRQIFAIIANLGRYYESQALKEDKKTKGFLGFTKQSTEFASNIQFLTEKGRFTPRMQTLLLDHIPVDSYETGQFFNSLYEELIPVARSGKVGASWSKLVLHQNELALKITPRQRTRRGSRVKF